MRGCSMSLQSMKELWPFSYDDLRKYTIGRFIQFQDIYLFFDHVAKFCEFEFMKELKMGLKMQKKKNTWKEREKD